MAFEPIEWIEKDGVAVAAVMRSDSPPRSTMFPTPPDLALQIGFVVYGSGSQVPPHEHAPIERKISGTAEVILIRSGRALVDFYGRDKRRFASRELATNDIVYFFGCGHGFRMLEDTVLLEIKQGPYIGPHEKVRFSDDSSE